MPKLIKLIENLKTCFVKKCFRCYIVSSIEFTFKRCPSRKVREKENKRETCLLTTRNNNKQISKCVRLSQNVCRRHMYHLGACVVRIMNRSLNGKKNKKKK